jgi:hypothetical protein
MLGLDPKVLTLDERERHLAVIERMQKQMAAKFGGLSKLVKKPSTTSAEAENEQAEEISEMVLKLGK